MSDERFPSILPHSVTTTDPYQARFSVVENKETHFNRAVALRENPKLGQAVNMAVNLPGKMHVPTASPNQASFDTLPIYSEGKPPVGKCHHARTPSLGLSIGNPRHLFPQEYERKRGRCEKLHYSKTLEAQAEEAKLLKMSLNQREPCQTHIEANCWKPQMRYIRPKARENIANFDPISGRHMPFYANSKVSRKVGPFDFDKFANNSKSLSVGDNHPEAIKPTYFPRCYTDVVQRRNPKQCIQIHDLRKETPYRWNESSFIPTGRPGNGAPLLDQNGLFDTRLIKYKQSNLERLQVKDFDRY